MARPRGRPRKFDEAKALEAAAAVFWRKGFNGTSLDDLAGAMEMNRPSIYGAFGDKEKIYRRTLEMFCGQMQQALAATMFATDNVEEAFTAFFSAALEVYTNGEQPLGCMVMCTAACEAPTHPDVLSDLQQTLHSIDANFEKRLDQAIAAGELGEGVNTRARAQIAQAILHTLSVRARAGESKAELNELIHSGVELLLTH